MSLSIIITNAGQAALVNASHTGSAAVTIAAIGVSTTAVVANPAATALPGEIKRLNSIGGTMVSANVISVSLLDDSSDAYELRAVGLYLADSTLFALYGQADPIAVKTTVAMIGCTFDIALTDASGAIIEFTGTGFTNPPASEMVVGVTRYATVAEAQAGAGNTMAVTPSAAKQAVVQWLSGKNIVVGALDAQTPGGNTTGGVRVRAAVDGIAYVQVTDRTGAGQFGYWRHTNAGEADWYGGSGLRSNGRTVLTVDNTGPGNGLNADMVDGRHADYFVAAAAFNPGNVMAMVQSVAGPGSGLNADMVDGKHAADLAPIPTANAGVGQFVTLVPPPGGSGNCVLAGDGSTQWAYFGANNGTGFAGVAPGGTEIWAGIATNFYGFAWRVR